MHGDDHPYQEGTTAKPPYSPGVNGNPTSQPFAGTGIFFYAVSYGINSIIDGTSNTIAYSESLAGNDQGNSYRGNSPTNVTAGDPSAVLSDARTNLTAVNTAATACTQALQAQQNVFGSTGSQWISGIMAYSLFNTIIPPNSTQYQFGGCKFRGTGVLEGVNIMNSQSFHSGGCNFMMADGSVRFIKSSVNQLTYMSLGTRSGGEVVSADAF